MEQNSEFRTLDFGQTLQDSFVIGFRNAASIVGCVLLWLVTIWIPYINIGTTIALSMLPIELAKGNIVSPLSIFAARYRKYMGEYLITASLMALPMLAILFYCLIVFIRIVQGTTLATGMNPDTLTQLIENPAMSASFGWIILGAVVAFFSVVVPMAVLAIAWSLSYYFLFDKNLNPIQSIKASNDATYGSKWMIFFASLLLGIIIVCVALIFMGICVAIGNTTVTVVVMLIVLAFLFSFTISLKASIWRQLKDNVA